jgi:hypothetical protein
MLTAQKSLRQNNSEKNRIPGEVFSLYFWLQDFPPTMMPFFIMYFSYLIGPPPTPVRASRARWVGVRIHVILLGMAGKMYYTATVRYALYSK